MNRNCPICGEKEAEVLDRVNFLNEKGNDLPSSYDIVFCKGCGFTYAKMDASQKLYDKYYSNINVYPESSKIKKYADSNQECFDFIYSLIKEKVLFSDKIIDVGCGAGDLLAYLKINKYNDLTGLDPSKSSTELLKKKGIKAVCQSLFDPVPDSLKHKFKLVISTMVAEHVYDLNTYVSRLTEYGKEQEGYLFLTVPDVMGFKQYICNKANYFNQEHINYFSVNSICNLFGKFGYWMVNEQYTDSCKERSLYLLFGKKDFNRAIKKDVESKESIQEYLKGYAKMENRIGAQIGEIINSAQKIVIWGGGQYTKQILERYQDLRKNLLYLVDNNTIRQGILIGDKEIFAPDKLYKEKECLTVCICSMNNAEDIRKQLQENCPKHKIIVL